MSRQSISCNIAIIPSSTIAKKAIVMSRRLKKYGGIYVLDGKNYFPHITLYMTEFPKKNLLAVKKAMKDITNHMKPFRLTFSRIHHDIRRGFIVAHFQKNKAIDTLHHRIVRVCNQFREGLIRSRDQKAFPTLTKRQKQNLLRYGYRDAYTLYRPHITFSRLPPLSRSLNLIILKTLPVSSVTTIGLFQSGDHGTCKKLLAVFHMRSCHA